MDKSVDAVEDVLAAAAAIFQSVEDADTRRGVTLLAAELLIPHSSCDEGAEALVRYAIAGMCNRSNAL